MRMIEWYQPVPKSYRNLTPGSVPLSGSGAHCSGTLWISLRLERVALSGNVRLDRSFTTPGDGRQPQYQ
jgi:hypothetical protein